MQLNMSLQKQMQKRCSETFKKPIPIFKSVYTLSKENGE
jgi:hypothetical protein